MVLQGLIQRGEWNWESSRLRTEGGVELGIFPPKQRGEWNWESSRLRTEGGVELGIFPPKNRGGSGTGNLPA